MNIVGKRKIWFTISILLILPGIIALVLWGLKPGIDFIGGQEMEVAGSTNQTEVREIVDPYLNTTHSKDQKSTIEQRKEQHYWEVAL